MVLYRILWKKVAHSVIVTFSKCIKELIPNSLWHMQFNHFLYSKGGYPYHQKSELQFGDQMLNLICMCVYICRCVGGSRVTAGKKMPCTYEE